jgi:hypothetical protein
VSRQKKTAQDAQQIAKTRRARTHAAANYRRDGGTRGFKKHFSLVLSFLRMKKKEHLKSTAEK